MLGEETSWDSACGGRTGEVVCLKNRKRLIKRKAERSALREDQNMAKVLGTKC